MEPIEISSTMLAVVCFASLLLGAIAGMLLDMALAKRTT